MRIVLFTSFAERVKFPKSINATNDCWCQS